jgi:ParB family chromosome partitioning protein
LRLQTIPAIVRDADDRDSLEVAIVENVLREELDPLEEAMGYANLIEEYGYTQERVAERLGKGRPTIANALRLLSLPDAIKGDLRAGRLSAGHARALLAFPPEERIPIASRIIGEELTVREVERLAAERESPAERAPRQKSVPSAKSPDIERVESRLRYRFGAQAAIEPGAIGGRITIRYVGEEDLIRLVDILVPEG